MNFSGSQYAMDKNGGYKNIFHLTRVSLQDHPNNCVLFDPDEENAFQILDRFRLKTISYMRRDMSSGIETETD